MTPAYLQNQLDQSLQNMNVECVDVYYITIRSRNSDTFPRQSLITGCQLRLIDWKRIVETENQDLRRGNLEWVSCQQGIKGVSFALPDGGCGAHRGWRISRLSLHSTPLQSGDA